MGYGITVDAVDGYNWETVVQKHGFNWEVEKVANVTADDHVPTGSFAIRRMDTRAILGKSVGNIFVPFQNKHTFGWFQPYLDAREAIIDTVGLLKGGSRIWALARMNRDPLVVAKDDEVNKYILLAHAHDGSLAIRLGFTPIRVICENTLRLAFNSKASKLIRVRHTSKAKQNLDNLREIMNLANSEFEATADQYRLLATKSINSADLTKYVKKVLGATDEKLSTRMQNIVDKVIGLCESGRGNDLASVRGTYWTAFNGIAEYLSHSYGNNQDNRLDSLWFGQNADLNSFALQTALEMAA